MPEGYRFPAIRNLWTPLRPGELSREPGEGVVQVFGRLAPGVTQAEAQAELTTLVARAADEFPDEYADLMPHVRPYAEAFMGIPPGFFMRAGIYALNVFAGLFLILCCSNVALLMFARAATREREILVRGALGAGRGRIVMQLFVEALVLGALAALLGLAATNYAFQRFGDAITSGLNDWPFWLLGGLSPTTLTYAVLLTLVAAAVVGVLPGLKVTRQWSGARLREMTTGASGLQMGGIWTGVIIAQIAATVLFTGVAYVLQIQASRMASITASFPADEYLGVRLEMDRESLTEEGVGTNQNGFLQNYSTTVLELKRQLALEPTVAAVTVAEKLPLMGHTIHRIEVDEGGAAVSSSQVVGTGAVDLDAFKVFQTPVHAGRGFDSRDVAEGAKTVVVNRLFVEKVLAGRNAVGRRIRYTAEDSRSPANGEPQPGPWLEIVGVVPDLLLDSKLPMDLDNPVRPLVYSPLGRGQDQIYPLYLAAHVRGDAASLSPTLRRVAGDLSPTLRLYDIQTLDRSTSSDAYFFRIVANVILLVSALALFLSLAGIYSVISFTVARRTREIAIRVALSRAEQN